MGGVTVPKEFHPLLESTAVAFVSTLGRDGEPQTTPLWFLFRDGAFLTEIRGAQSYQVFERALRVE